MTQRRPRLTPIELSHDDLVVADLFVRDALYYIGGPAFIAEILRVLEAHPYLRITSASRDVVLAILRTGPLIRRAGKETWRLTESREDSAG